MPVQVIIDEYACIGSGECVALDPEAIAIDDSGVAYMLVGEMSEDRAERLCRSCPVEALRIGPA